MSDDEVLKMLRAIRDETRTTRARVAALEDRVALLGQHGSTRAVDTRRPHQPARAKTPLSTALIALSTITRELKDVLVDANISELKARVAALEARLSSADY